jgi:molybdate transport system substrate-binding protein
MLNLRKISLISGISAAALVACSPAHATTISVGVAANFANPLSDIITAFKSYYNGYGFDVTYTSKSTGALETDIINGGASGPYDLFLAADKAHVDDLVTTHSSLVYPYTKSPSALYEFHYASGLLEFYSKTVNINSSGLPAPFTTNFVIADPVNAPYGKAAKQLLTNAPWTYTSAIPGGYVFTASNIDNTLAAIDGGSYAYGFVAKSQICKVISGVETFTNYHYSYTTGYDPIVQYGVEIAITSRTSAQQDELDKFVDFILNNATAQGIIQSYCYSYP